MNQDLLIKYAKLLTGYCCDIKKGQRVLVRSSMFGRAFYFGLSKGNIRSGR